MDHKCTNKNGIAVKDLLQKIHGKQLFTIFPLKKVSFQITLFEDESLQPTCKKVKIHFTFFPIKNTVQ